MNFHLLIDISAIIYFLDRLKQNLSSGYSQHIDVNIPALEFHDYLNTILAALNFRFRIIKAITATPFYDFDSTDSTSNIWSKFVRHRIEVSAVQFSCQL